MLGFKGGIRGALKAIIKRHELSAPGCGILRGVYVKASYSKMARHNRFITDDALENMILASSLFLLGSVCTSLTA